MGDAVAKRRIYIYIHKHEVGRIDNFEALARKLSFFPSWIFLIYDNSMYVFYLSFNVSFGELFFFISNTEKHEFSSIWKWISCSNDVMNHVDFAVKRDVYPQKMHSCSENIRGLSFFILKISVVYLKMYNDGDTLD